MSPFLTRFIPIMYRPFGDGQRRPRKKSQLVLIRVSALPFLDFMNRSANPSARDRFSPPNRSHKDWLDTTTTPCLPVFPSKSGSTERSGSARNKNVLLLGLIAKDVT